MPLSKDEQRRLDEIEQALLADDPTFGSQSIERVWRRRTVTAGAVVLMGVVLLLVGVVTTQAAQVAGVIIGVIGFLMMVGGATLFIRRPRQ